MITRVIGTSQGFWDCYIGRAGKGEDGYFGNPFPVSMTGSIEESVRRYRDYFNHRIAYDAEFLSRVMDLRGKVLGCPGNCKPGPCHGDVIVAFLNGL